MEIDSDTEQSTKKKTMMAAHSLHTLFSNPVSSTLRSLTSTTKSIPSEEDFHFYYNFPEFKTPVKQIIQNTHSTLQSISTSTLFDKNLNFNQDDIEEDEGYDWLVNLNDEIWEKFDSCVDEFKKVRKLEEESGRRMQVNDDDGFQVVDRRKGRMGNNRNVERGDGAKRSAVKTVEKQGSGRSAVKAKVPFHIPSIVRPQTQFKIVVDNSNEAFEHVWLEKSEDGTRYIHPLENFTELDFIDKHNGDVELVKPLPVESTPFELVEDVKDLTKLAAKLHDVNEFAVDLEHNHYRSFHGLTCLMQISTRSEDFVVDTLKLHAHVGPHLRDVFKDPSKKKVMHGADRDIVWLQRDFGIYVCNMFDTGQASRVLNLERNSLEYLLHHFCGVTANKEYQSADWRLRPIPSEMLRYAREDTHYLLHIYDLMRLRLREASTDSENIDSLLVEVYKRSYEVCIQLYEKDIWTDTSYLHIYGVQGAELNSQQLAVVAGLCEWRDSVARAEDESTGFVLPNRALIEIARQMPVTAGKLRRLLNSRHSYVERNLGSVVGIIKRSIENAPAFESISQQLQKECAEMEAARNMAVEDETEMLIDTEFPTEEEFVSAQESINEEDNNRVTMETSNSVTNTLYAKDVALEVANTVGSGTCGRQSLDLSDEGRDLMKGDPIELRRDNFVLTGQDSTEATVQVLKKPSRAFGALFGKSSSKRKLGADLKVEMKVEQIKSSVTLPFHSFSGGSVHSEPQAKIESTAEPKLHPTKPISMEGGLEDVISLENVSIDDEPSDGARVANDNNLESTETNCTSGGLEADTGEKPMSLSELSTSFDDCLQSINEKRNNKSSKKPEESRKYLPLKPFDYAAAREQMKFGEGGESKKPKEEGGQKSQKNLLHSKERRKNSASSQVPREDTGTKESKNARRRMAFPPTGNRSATFR